MTNTPCNVLAYRHFPKLHVTLMSLVKLQRAGGYEPRMDTHKVMDSVRRHMVLDVREHLKKRDSCLSYRGSCHEDVCNSDCMNINGQTAVAYGVSNVRKTVPRAKIGSYV